MRQDRSIVRATAQVRAEFFDCDPMGVVWHGNYAKFLELGRVAVLGTIDYGYAAMAASGYAWPVVDMAIKYAQPIKLLQQIEVDAGIVEWENRLKINFEIRDKATGRRLTRAHSVHVAVDIATEQMQWETPPILREKLKPWL
jgi:acyl-CoA thioester hydrolase